MTRLWARFRQVALPLPDSTESPHHKYTSFRIRDKIFATALPDGQFLHVFLSDQDRAKSLAQFASIVSNLIWGVRVVGLRVDLPLANRAVVQTLLARAWSKRHRRD